MRRLVTQPCAGHPWLELDDTWIEPESHLNAGRRSDLRRAMRNACEARASALRNYDPYSGRPCTAAAAMRFWWSRRAGRESQGSALATDPQVGAFYTQLAQVACELGTLRIGMLRIGDRAAAMQLAIEQDGCFWLFKMGFDESFARFSPGTLLMVESLRSARQRGCNRYELMGKSEAWNQIWAPRMHEAVSLSLCTPTVRGWVNVIAEHAKGAIRTQLRGRMESHE